MTDKNKIINHHIWRLRFKNLKFVAPIAALFLIAAGLGLFQAFSPISNRETMEGVVESFHQVQGGTGSGTALLYVRLANKDLVQVPISSSGGIPFRKFAKVKIEKIEKESGSIKYLFLEYSE